ncbi:unnamed protein product [Spirodela intermedia]|uniref:Uncharacterized protein n=1 Tax=Spirodela intermedia TaxID=51605 RepID=A0A7I8JQM9_SPIIN|nr:unnamed protein product [Spirodela intermedia]CAA6672479.1 unnamed protein product [Spirodela intermedia]
MYFSSLFELMNWTLSMSTCQWGRMKRVKGKGKV